MEIKNIIFKDLNEKLDEYCISGKEKQPSLFVYLNIVAIFFYIPMQLVFLFAFVFFNNKILITFLFFLFLIFIISSYLIIFIKNKSIPSKDNNYNQKDKEKLIYSLNESNRNNWISQLYGSNLLDKWFKNNKIVGVNKYRFYVLINDVFVNKNKENSFFRYLEKCHKENIAISNEVIEQEYYKEKEYESDRILLNKLVGEFNNFKIKYVNLFENKNDDEFILNKIDLRLNQPIEKSKEKIKSIIQLLYKFNDSYEYKSIEKYDLLIQTYKLNNFNMSISEKDELESIKKEFLKFENNNNLDSKIDYMMLNINEKNIKP